MIQMIPIPVADYLKKRGQNLLSVAYIFVDRAGKITKAGGNFKYFDLDTPPSGETAAERFVFLEGLTRQPEEALLLPGIHVTPYSRADISLLPEGKGFWTIFQEPENPSGVSDKAIQQVNEKMLSDESYRVIGSATLLADSLHVLEYMIWEKENEVFRLKSYPANWFLRLFPGSEKELVYPDLTVYFPFLEAFITEAHQVWQKSGYSKADSDLWTESDDAGNEFYLQAIAANPGGRSLLIIGTQNISGTDRKELMQKAREKSLYSEQLEKTEAQLRKLLNFKNQFVSIVSHDLRSPLSSVISGFEYIMSDEQFKANLDENTVELITEMKDELDRVLDYNQKLYHWSNLELGKFNMNIKSLSVSSLFSQILNRFIRQSREKDIELITDYEDFTLKADEALFSQALNNLIQNALKFTPSGKKIKISASPGKHYSRIEIADEGVGIPDALQEDLFKKVTHLHTEGTAGEKGSGLGLSIAKNIIEAHNMSLHFSSSEGKGTSFYIDIPAEEGLQ